MLGLLGRQGLPDSEVTLAYHALIEYVVGSAAIGTAGTADFPDEAEASRRGGQVSYCPPRRYVASQQRRQAGISKMA